MTWLDHIWWVVKTKLAYLWIFQTFSFVITLISNNYYRSVDRSVILAQGVPKINHPSPKYNRISSNIYNSRWTWQLQLLHLCQNFIKIGEYDVPRLAWISQKMALKISLTQCSTKNCFWFTMFNFHFSCTTFQFWFFSETWEHLR